MNSRQYGSRLGTSRGNVIMQKVFCFAIDHDPSVKTMLGTHSLSSQNQQNRATPLWVSSACWQSSTGRPSGRQHVISYLSSHCMKRPSHVPSEKVQVQVHLCSLILPFEQNPDLSDPCRSLNPLILSVYIWKKEAWSSTWGCLQTGWLHSSLNVLHSISTATLPCIEFRVLSWTALTLVQENKRTVQVSTPCETLTCQSLSLAFWETTFTLSTFSTKVPHVFCFFCFPFLLSSDNLLFLSTLKDLSNKAHFFHFVQTQSHLSFSNRLISKPVETLPQKKFHAQCKKSKPCLEIA